VLAFCRKQSEGKLILFDLLASNME
jgi:hypothetical protein